MAPKEDLRQIGEQGFEAIDRFFGHQQQQQQQHYLHHRSEVPMETAPSPYFVYRRTMISQVPQQFFPSPPPPEPPRGFQFGRLFPVKQQNPPKRMSQRRGFPPLGTNRVEYPPQEQHENGAEGWLPAAEAGDMNNIKAARLFGGVTRVDRRWF